MARVGGVLRERKESGWREREKFKANGAKFKEFFPVHRSSRAFPSRVFSRLSRRPLICWMTLWTTSLTVGKSYDQKLFLSKSANWFQTCTKNIVPVADGQSTSLQSSCYFLHNRIMAKKKKSKKMWSQRRLTVIHQSTTPWTEYSQNDHKHKDKTRKPV